MPNRFDKLIMRASLENKTFILSNHATRNSALWLGSHMHLYRIYHLEILDVAVPFFTFQDSQQQFRTAHMLILASVFAVRLWHK